MRPSLHVVNTPTLAHRMLCSMTVPHPPTPRLKNTIATDVKSQSAVVIYLTPVIITRIMSRTQRHIFHSLRIHSLMELSYICSHRRPGLSDRPPDIHRHPRRSTWLKETTRSASVPVTGRTCSTSLSCRCPYSQRQSGTYHGALISIFPVPSDNSDGEEVNTANNVNDIYYSLKYEADILFTRFVIL